MKKFLFITHKTPAARQSGLRKKLFAIYLDSLQRQTYPHWELLLIGEKEDASGKITEVAVDPSTRDTLQASLHSVYERPDVKKLIAESDYIVKLDDDDVISPNILELAASQDFDCYFDEYHTFYDLTSGVISQQKRPWIASTCIHRREHAAYPLHGDDGNFMSSLFYSDHSKAWHTYYAGKQIVRAKPEQPVYLRILSPTSITAGAKVFPPMSMTDISMKAYYNYLKTFGYWHRISLPAFESYMKPLAQAWKDFSGTDHTPIQGISIFDRFKDRLLHAAGIRK